MTGLRRFGALLAVIVTVGGFVAAQGRWYEPYKKGLEALDAGRWAEAITQFERAIAIDARPAANKTYEGVYGADYFPQLYLGQAYLRDKQLDKAATRLEEARRLGRLPSKLQELLDRLDAELASAREAARRPAPAPAAPAVDPRFGTLLQQAQAAIRSRRFEEALRVLDELRRVDSVQFSRRGLEATRREAADGLAAETAAAEATRRQSEYASLLSGAATDQSAGRFEDALAKLQRAGELDAGRFAADGGAARVTALRGQLADRQRRETRNRAQQLVDAGRSAAARGRYAEAVAQYRQALVTDPGNPDATLLLESQQQFEALIASSGEMVRRGNHRGAVQALENARRIAPDRFAAEGLDRRLTDLNARIEPPTVDGRSQPAYPGLVALLSGDAQGAIELLKPIANGRAALDTEVRADVHAFLGAAYAWLALGAPRAEDRSRNRGQALEQFGLALTLRPDYELPPRLISPAILAIFAEARRR